MKVYVEDLLVKNCSCCDFCYTNSQGCVCKLTGHLTRYDEPLEEMRNKCPLIPISDYTKQVRKGVSQEVLSLIDEKFNCCGYVEEKFIDIVKYVLEQIQGENK